MAVRHPAVYAAQRLREALDLSAAALTGVHLDALLAGETALQDITASIPSAIGLSSDERLLLRTELDAARASLARCRQLGASLTAFVRITLDAEGRTVGYDAPRTAAAALAGRDLNLRA